AYWGRMTGAPDHMSVGVPQYAEVSGEYYRRIATTFPADILLRGWAAVIKVLDLPYSGAQSLRSGVVPEALRRVTEKVTTSLSRLAGLGMPLFVGVVLVLSARSVRLSTFLVGLVAFLGAYPAIQFQRRH